MFWKFRIWIIFTQLVFHDYLIFCNFSALAKPRVIRLFYHEKNRQTGHLLYMFPAEGLDCFLLRWWISFREGKMDYVQNNSRAKERNCLEKKKKQQDFSKLWRKMFKFNAKKKSPFHLAFSIYSHKENSDSRSKIHMFE